MEKKEFQSGASDEDMCTEDIILGGEEEDEALADVTDPTTPMQVDATAVPPLNPGWVSVESKPIITQQIDDKTIIKKEGTNWIKTFITGQYGFVKPYELTNREAIQRRQERFGKVYVKQAYGSHFNSDDDLFNRDSLGVYEVKFTPKWDSADWIDYPGEDEVFEPYEDDGDVDAKKHARFIRFGPVEN